MNTSKKFPLGRIVLTPSVLEIFTRYKILRMLARHRKGDWGDISKSGALLNDEALQPEVLGRLISIYKIDKDRACWIITEADYSVTTIFLPEDF